VPLASVAPGLPQGVAFVVMRAIAKDPADRHLNAERFGVALAEAATTAWGVGWLNSAGLKVMAVGPIHAATGRPSLPPGVAGGTVRSPQLASPVAGPPLPPVAAPTVAGLVAGLPGPPQGRTNTEPVTWSGGSDGAQPTISTQPRLDGLSAPSPVFVGDRPEAGEGHDAGIPRGRSRTAGTDPDARRSRRRRLAAIGAAVIIAAGAAAAAITQLGHSSGTGPSATFAFSPQSYASGLVVDRLWTLSGKSGSELHGTVTLADAAAAPIDGSYSEVLPGQVAASVHKISFDPAPNKIVEVDPVVRYEINLSARQTFKIRYSVDVGPTTGSWLSRLERLARDQGVAQTSFLDASGQQVPATLATLSVSKRSVVVNTGQSVSVTLAGKMSNGRSAPVAALDGVAWSSANNAVATVSNGIVKGLNAGETTVTAQAGFLKTAVAVSVVGSSAPSAETSSTSGGSSTVPRSTTTTGPGSTTNPSTTTRTSGPASTSPSTPVSEPGTGTVPTSASTTVPRSTATTEPPTTVPPTTVPPTTIPTTTVPTTAPPTTAPPTTAPPTTAPPTSVYTTAPTTEPTS
jgi:hypothetical protein